MASFFSRQKWVRIIMASGGKMEIMVKQISSEEAKKNILTNTKLRGSQIFVATLLSKNFRYLSDNQLCITQKVYFETETGTMASTIGGLLSHDSETLGYLVTGAHNSYKSARYYSDVTMTKDTLLGECTHWYYDDKLDVAFVKLEPSITRDRLYNLLNLPYGTTLQEFMPVPSNEALQDLVNNKAGALKHGHRLMRGHVVNIRDDHSPMYAVMAPLWREGTCLAGESGSLITKLPGGESSRLLPALGILKGLTEYEREYNGKKLLTEACVFTPLWSAMERFCKETDKKVKGFRFIPPIVSETECASGGRVVATGKDRSLLGSCPCLCCFQACMSKFIFPFQWKKPSTSFLLRKCFNLLQFMNILLYWFLTSAHLETPCHFLHFTIPHDFKILGMRN